MSASLSQNPVSFHISLNVSDIDRSAAFFRRVFDTEPSKKQNDYAKFELKNPPITLSLEPVSPDERGALNHVGFKLQSTGDLVELQRRLEMAGIKSEREEGVECCYSKQTKFWLHDPDGTLWEMYIVEGDIEHRGAGQSPEAVLSDNDPDTSPCSTDQTPAETKRWSHRLGTPVEIPDEIAVDSLDKIDLQGSFNGADTMPRIGPFLQDAARRLKGGGRIAIHCLTADRHVDEVPQLPGPASVVKSVPCLDSLIESLEEAGFEAIRLTTYRSGACFTAGSAELRETKIEALKQPLADVDTVAVVYKGPHAEVKLDGGQILKRGRKTTLPRNVALQLTSAPGGDSFVVMDAATSPVSCTG